MFIERFFWFMAFYPSMAHFCSQQLTSLTGTIVFPSYENNLECIWTFNFSSIDNSKDYRTLLLTFHHFDTEFGHDELWIGESIPDVSKYNSKLYRFSGRKLPDPCVISLRSDLLTRPIWMQFISDQTTTGSGFIVDYVFLVNQCKMIMLVLFSLYHWIRPTSAEILTEIELREMKFHLSSKQIDIDHSKCITVFSEFN